MKKPITLLGLLAITSIGMAQNPRTTLYEEFTGETCPPCAATNPYLDPVLAANAGVVTIKWQVPIPSAPTKPISLYQQNKTEIDTRRSYYSVNSAPNGRIDGQGQATFGATGTSPDHPANVVNSPGILTTAVAVTTPFTMSLSRQWDATYSTITVTGTITATNAFTANGNFKMRLVMTEKHVKYDVQPGTNGETEFNWVARKSFPDITNGTALPGTWTAAQTQTFSIACPLPSYIWDKSQVEMVAFLQDDGNKKVWQAAIANAVPLTDDAAALAIAGLSPVSCSTSFTPQVNVKNNGSNAITTMTITPYLDGVAGTPYAYSGNIAVGGTVNVTINPQTGVSGGTHSFSVAIASNVNGSVDYNLGNNTSKGSLAIVSTYTTTPIVEGFQATAFPPANWFLVNTDGGTATWGRSTAAGAGSSASSKMDFYNNGTVGDVDELYLPPMSLAGLTSPAITYDMAYSGYLESGNSYYDQVDIMASTDCGANWTTLKSWTGAAMTTAPAVGSAFTPNASQWRNEFVALPASFVGQAQVLVKFVGTSNYSNNFYVDNVNINNNAVSVKEEVKGIASANLFPNPANAATNLSIVTSKDVDLNITVVNAVGQIVAQKSASATTGANTIVLDTQNFAEGIYNVMISSTEGAITKKLTVIK